MPPFALPALAPPTAMSVAQAIDGKPSFSSGRGQANKYGMQMWFEVSVGNLPGDDLGEWSQCTGLGVTFSVDDIRTGAGSMGKNVLPKDVEFPEIKLTRASDEESTRRVRDWLEQVAQEWVLSDGTTKTYAGATVTIQLFSALRSGTGGSKDAHRVHEWVITGAYPKSWTGPQLNAKSNDVATEQLTLVHDGWMDLKKVANQQLTLDDGRVSLRFPVMPADIKVTRQAPSTTTTTMVYGANEAAVDRSKTQINLSTTIDGAKEVRWVHELLLAWVKKRVDDAGSPVKGGVGPGVAGQKEEEATEDFPVGLRLKVGSAATAFTRIVRLTNATTTFKYFTLTGEPARADFALALEVMVAQPGKSLSEHPSVRDLAPVEEEPSEAGVRPPSGLSQNAFADRLQKRKRALRSSAPVGGTT